MKTPVCVFQFNISLKRTDKSIYIWNDQAYFDYITNLYKDYITNNSEFLKELAKYVYKAVFCMRVFLFKANVWHALFDWFVYHYYQGILDMEFCIVSIAEIRHELEFVAAKRHIFLSALIIHWVRITL